MCAIFSSLYDDEAMYSSMHQISRIRKMTTVSGDDAGNLVMKVILVNQVH